MGEERIKINLKKRKKYKRKKTEKQVSHLGCPHQVLPLLLNHTSQHYKNILCRIHQHSVPEHKATGNGRTASGTLTKANRKKRCRYSQQKTFISACQTVAENSLKTVSFKRKVVKQEHVDRGNRTRGAHHCRGASHQKETVPHQPARSLLL